MTAGGDAAADKSLIGAAGEYLVLSRLLARGLMATPTPRGARMVDVIVTLPNGLSRRVQVKTKVKGAGWAMNEKHERLIDADFFFCFVDLEPPKSDVYVVPAKVVAKILKDGHSLWLRTLGKSGQRRKDNPMRKIHPTKSAWPEGDMSPYLENWALILT